MVLHESRVQKKWSNFDVFVVCEICVCLCVCDWTVRDGSQSRWLDRGRFYGNGQNAGDVGE